MFHPFLVVVLVLLSKLTMVEDFDKDDSKEKEDARVRDYGGDSRRAHGDNHWAANKNTQEQ